MVENTGANEKEGAEARRHLFDHSDVPGPKGALAHRKEVIVKKIRQDWLEIQEVELPAHISTSLIQWAERHRPGEEVPFAIARAFNDAKDDPDTRDGFVLAYKHLVARNATLLPDQLEQVGPIPEIIVQGAKLPKNRKRGGTPQPHRREFLAIEVAKASWRAGLNPTRNDSKEPEPDAPPNDLPSGIDLVARATGFTYGHVRKAWFTLIDGRSPQYLLDRWEREANEPS